MPSTPITINGAIDAPGESYQYAFRLESDIKLLFDSLTNNSNVYWSLTGPRGVVISQRSFSASDSTGLPGSPVLELPAGSYTLTVYASADNTGSYGFRLLDVSTAPAITSGAIITGQLGPARETDVYQFEVTAGERYYFDLQGVSATQSHWRLVDPHGKVIFGPTHMWSLTDVDVQTLTVSGMYLLLIEGDISQTLVDQLTALLCQLELQGGIPAVLNQQHQR